MSILSPDELDERLRSRSESFLELLGQRRSIKKLVSGPFPPEVRDRVLQSIQLTPAAYNQPPWLIVLVEERRLEFWAMFESAARLVLMGNRLDRQLARIVDFREAVAIALVYEDLSISGKIQSAWHIGADDADAFVQQALGMVQLSIWLSLVGDGLATSLQHWSWLAGQQIDAFAGVNPVTHGLAAVMPIGYAAEQPRDVERPAIETVVHFEQSRSNPE